MVDETTNTAAALPYRLKKCRHGNFLYNQQDRYIGRSLDAYGEYVDEEIRLLIAMIGPGDFVVEAGANMGADTVPLARRVGPTGHVLAIEPQRIVHQLLCANIALNGLVNVTTPWCAVGAATGEAVVPPIDYGQSQNFGGVALRTEGAGERVPVVPIDQFELMACALLKIDVEGMEQDVLRGAHATIKRFKPILYIENNAGSKSPPMIRHVLDLGYHLFWHTPSLFNPRNFAGNAQDIFGDVRSCNMLCVPPGHAKQGVTENLRPVLGVDDVALESQRGRP